MPNVNPTSIPNVIFSLDTTDDVHHSLYKQGGKKREQVSDYPVQPGRMIEKLLCRLLLAGVRKVDLCARLGGDEFAVLMPETGAEDALVVAERLRDAMLKSFRDGGASVGMSGGLGTFSVPPVDAHVPLNQADQLMYEAKRSGKNRIVARTFP